MVAIGWEHPNYGYFSDAMVWIRSMHMSDWEQVPVMNWSREYEDVEDFLEDYPEFSEFFEYKPSQEFLDSVFGGYRDGTTGTIWYHRGPLELKGVGVQMDGGPESLGVLAVEQRLKLEELVEKHGLSRSEALDLLWGETVDGHFEPTIWDAEWNYTMTNGGLEIRWGEDNSRFLSMEELEEAHESNRIEELISSAIEDKY